MKTIILKNTTVSEIFVLKRQILALDQDDFSTEKESDFRSDLNLLTLISTGDIVVNDGTSDLDFEIGQSYVSGSLIIRSDTVTQSLEVTGIDFGKNLTVTSPIAGAQKITAAISLEKDDIAVTGSPHDTINFEGELGVTDNTGGKVTIATTGDLAAAEGLSTTGLITRTATDTWTTRSIIGTSNQIDIANGDGIAANPTLTIADNVVLPGTGSLTFPIGTTAQRPVTPTVGMMRWNSTLSCNELWDGTEWTCFRTTNSLVGGLYQMIFSVNGIIKNAWMDQGADNVSSNASPAVCLARSEIEAYTFVNSRTGADSNIEVYRTPEGVAPGTTQDLLDTWNIIDSRTRRKTNFGTPIILDAGDKIGVFSRDPGSGSTSPNSMIFIIFLRFLEDNFEEVTDNTSGNMTA